MKELILEMPTMYADHHVLKVREALDGLKGIDEAYALSLIHISEPTRPY